MVVLRHSCFVDVDTASASKCTCRLAQDASEKSAHSHNISDMVAEQRGYTPWMGEEPKDGVGLVKTVPRKRPQRRRVEMSGELLVGSAANLEHPPLGGSGWDGTETDLKENVLELEADDLDEKIINDGVKVKRLRSELGVAFTCLNPARKIQEHSVVTKTVTLDELTTKNVL